MVLAALELLKTRQTPLATQAVLDTIPLLERDVQRFAAHEALWRSVRPHQAPLLRAAIQRGPVDVKAAAFEHFDKRRKSDREIEIFAWNMKMCAVCNQRDANEQ